MLIASPHTDFNCEWSTSLGQMSIFLLLLLLSAELHKCLTLTAKRRAHTHVEI